jgi:hypothetical protein
MNNISLTKVDPLSEMLALSSYGNIKNIIVTAIETIGVLDEEAFVQAAKIAASSFPQILSRLKEIKEKGRYHLFWEYRQDEILPLRMTDMKTSDGTVSLNEFLDHISPRLDRNWNLFEEPACEFYFVRLAADHHILAVAVHHAAADGVTASEFGKEIFSNYHEIKTGRRPDWAREVSALSSTRKRLVKVKSLGWKKALAGVRQTVRRLTERPLLPAGHGNANDLRQFHIKRVLSIDESDVIVKKSLGRGVSPVDLLAADAAGAVDVWNATHNVGPGLLTISMTVNMRGRFRGLDRPNTGGVIFFRSMPEDREDVNAFARSMAAKRIGHFRRQEDFAYYSDVNRMTDSLRLFPFNTRRKIVDFIVNRYQVSIGVTLLGVIWPKLENGKMTADSYLTSTGDLEIDQVHGVGYKLLSSTRALLIAYFYKKQLNVVLAASACQFTHAEAEAFTDIIIEILSGP